MIDIAANVTFDLIRSFTDLGLILAKRPEIGTPGPKLSMVDVPGADGLLDLTEFNAGRVCYGNRTIVFTFAAMVAEDQQGAFRRNITSKLHGKRIKKIVIGSDPNFYYSGRCSVAFEDVHDWKLKCVVTVDADPFAVATNYTRIDLRSGTRAEQTVDLMGVDRAGAGADVFTDLRFGTASYPTLDLSIYTDLIIRKPSSASASTATVMVYDSETNAHSASVTFSADSASVPISDIASGGVDVAGIYRIEVLWCPGCTAYARNTMYKTVVDVGDAPAVPQVELQRQSPVDVYVVAGGQTVKIPNGVSQGDVVIPPNDPNVYMYTATPSDVNHVYLTFTRRGI